MGESGIGKSTLLNLVAGLDRPDAGSIRLDGVDLAALDDDALTALRRVKMGFVFQAFHVLPYLTVGQNVALPLSLVGVSDADGDRRRCDAMLAAVGLADRSASMPRELSGGELQRVAIARALVHGPQLVLADEPTGNLDADSAAQVLRLLRDQVKANGAAGILVTHSRAAAATADRVLVLTREGLQAGMMGNARPGPMAMVLRGALAQNRTRTVLSVLAIALGVALGYAVQLINAAAVNELAQGVKTLSGDADLEVRGPRGGFAGDDLSGDRADGGRGGGEPRRRSRCQDRRQRGSAQDHRRRRVSRGIHPARTDPDSADRLDTLRPDALFMSPAAARSLGVATGDTRARPGRARRRGVARGGRARVGGQPALRG